MKNLTHLYPERRGHQRLAEPRATVLLHPVSRMRSKRHIQVGNLYNMLNVGLNISWFPANCIHLQVHYAKKKKMNWKKKRTNAAKAAFIFEPPVGGSWLFSDLQWGK